MVIDHGTFGTSKAWYIANGCRNDHKTIENLVGADRKGLSKSSKSANGKVSYASS